MRGRLYLVLAMIALSQSASIAQGTAADRFVVGIGRSIHDTNGVTAAYDWLGVRSVRLDAPWQTIETAPDHYTVPGWLEQAVGEARAHGVEPLLILDYGHPRFGSDKPRTPAATAAFVRYAAYVVAHFKGRVRLFDLWNEWETHTGRTTPGSPEDYVALAKDAYPAIKAANPDAVVLSGGMLGSGLDSGWLEGFFKAGGLQYVDALSVHPYNYQRPALDSPERSIDQLDRIHALMQQHAGKRRIDLYVTEMGYPVHAGQGGVSENVAALYLARFYLLASTRDYIAGVWWYCLRDQGTSRSDKEQNFGVMDFAMAPKPPARALRNVAAVLAETPRFRDDSSGTQRRVSGTRPDGTAVVLSWSERSADTALLDQLAMLAARPQSPSALRTGQITSWR